MKFVHHLVIASSLIAWSATGAHAAETAAPTDQSVYAALGSFGASVGYEKRFGDFWGGHWGTRLLVNTGSLGHGRTHADLSGNRYDIKVKTGAGISSLFDYYPSLDSGWRVTGGVILSRIHSDLTGQPNGQGNYSLNDHVYSASQVGTLTGQLKYNPTLLYLGGGWESTAAGAKGWRFVSDAGLFMTDKAKATLTATGAASNSALQADIQAERAQLEKRGLGLMVQLGAAYAF